MTSRALALSLFSSIPLLAAAENATASTRFDGKTITITARSTVSKLSELPLFDVKAFTNQGGIGMKSGYYRLDGNRTCDVTPVHTQGNATGCTGKFQFNAVRVFGTEKIILARLNESFSAESEDGELQDRQNRQLHAFELKRARDLIVIGPAQTPDSLKTFRNGLAMPKAAELNDGMSEFTRSIYQATVTDDGKLFVSIISFRSEPPKTKTGIRLFSPTPDYWKVTGYSVSEGVGKDTTSIKARHESLLNDYIAKQPEPVRSLMLGTSNAEKIRPEAISTFFNKVDASTIKTIVAQSGGPEICITQKDIGVPVQEFERNSWGRGDCKVVYNFSLNSALPWHDKNKTASPSAEEKRYIKMIVDVIPEMTRRGAAEDFANEVMWRYGISILNINQDGVSLRIEHGENGSNSQGYLKAPAGNDRQARILLKKILLAEMEKR